MKAGIMFDILCGTVWTMRRTGAVLLLLLMIFLPGDGFSRPFQWPDKPLFERLEIEFLAARDLPERVAVSRFGDLEREGRTRLSQFDPAGSTYPEALIDRFVHLEFRMGTIAAAHAALIPRLQGFITDLNHTILPASGHWKADPDTIHQALYRLIYGGRAAVEEAWLQSESASLPSLLKLSDIELAVPSAMVEGVRVQSGDILLSRAGAPTSALISRGNDYQGNFSHVALLYVDATTETPSVIEAHIEQGVVISSAAQYFRDKKQRILLLRLRPDHPALAGNPDLPHEAASAMLARARKRLIAYDFAMNYQNDDKLFCSEVVYHAYRDQGIELWQTKSEMTPAGLRAWLGGMGVKSFRTLAPSDLEYDPQLVAVAEWRDLDVLREDRLDNAMMDALLEEAEKGLRLSYPAYLYPVAAGVKAWGKLQQLFGHEPQIPEGMSVAAALRARSLVEKVYPLLRKRLRNAAIRYRQEHGYSPPYWSLLQLARQVLAESLPDLSPYLVRTRS